MAIEAAPNSEPIKAPTVRDAVIRLLREFGLTTVFGNPGSTELPLFKRLRFMV